MKKFFLLLFLNNAPKKIGITLCFTLCILHCTSSFAQNPLVKMWDRRYGGTGGEYLKQILETREGDYLLAGTSVSGISGDKSQASWGSGDYWIIKLDSSGTIKWDKNFGGLSGDELISVVETSDKGFILGGNSISGIGGDKTQPLKGLFAYQDFWIVKIDSLGNKEWDKDFGGYYGEVFKEVIQTFDGGYLVGGISYSGIGGDKTQPSNGGDDYWVIKIDSLGNKLWDRDFGGTADDNISSIKQTSDGGFILAGLSLSDISGDKTQPLRGNFGYEDYWIVKIDSIGNKQWDKDFGGDYGDRLYSVQETYSGGLILAGISESPVSGDKTQPLWGQGADDDFWVLKTDSQGNKLWDRDYGGWNDEDEFGSLTLTPDSGFLITGTSYSGMCGNKTQANLGQEQTWSIKLDSIGNFKLDKTLFTTGHDENGVGIELRGGCFIIGNSNNDSIGGYKTQVNWGIGPNYWIVKFCPQVHSNFIVNEPTFCPGTCVSFYNISTFSLTYQWSFPGASPDTSTDVNPQNICYATPGSYDVQLIATNPNGSDTLLLTNYITVYPSPPPQSITQSGDTLFAIVGGGTYQWYFNNSIINGATDYYYVAAASGDYNVVVADTNGCEVEAAVFNVVAAVSSGGYQELSIFPNPVVEEFTIQNAQFTPDRYRDVTAIEISVYNMLGENIDCAFDRRLLTVDCQLLPAGMYWLEVYSSEKTYRTKFIKQ